MAEQPTLGEQFGHCPFATVQSLIAGKWATLILHHLDEGARCASTSSCAGCPG